MATGEPAYDPTVASAAIVSIGSGLTLSGAGALTNDLITGKAGGQTVIGGTAANEVLTLKASSHATGGPVKIGSVTADTAYGLDLTDATRGNQLWGTATVKGALSYSGSGPVSIGSATNHGLSLFTNSVSRLLIGSAGGFTVTEANDFTFGTVTGTKFGTATTQLIGFYNKTPVVQQARAGTLTNNVTVGGTTDQVDDFVGAVYATDAAAIRNDIYQLARAVRQHDVALRALGLES